MSNIQNRVAKLEELHVPVEPRTFLSIRLVGLHEGPVKRATIGEHELLRQVGETVDEFRDRVVTWIKAEHGGTGRRVVFFDGGSSVPGIQVDSH